MSHFWKELQETFRTKLSLKTAFHLATDGQTERTIQTLEDLLRSCVLEFGTDWKSRLALVEFSFNNSFHLSIRMASFKALYGRKCRTPLCWEYLDINIPTGPDLILEIVDRVKVNQGLMKRAQDRQKSYNDNRRRKLEFEVGHKVFLKFLQ